MRFGLTSSPSTSGESFVDKHFRHAPRSRLIAYAVACLAVFVAIILWVTLSGDDEDSKYRGSYAIKESPLVDGFGGFSWQIHSRFKDSITDLDLEKAVKDSKDVTLQMNLSDLLGGSVAAQIWEITDSCDSKEPLLSAVVQHDLINKIVKRYPQRLKFGSSSADVSSSFDPTKTAIFSSLNGGHMMTSKLAVLRHYYEMGIRIFTLNKVECVTKKLSKFVATEDPTDKSKFVLSKFVEAVINELNRLGMIIDLSGSDMNTQLEVLKKTKAPAIFSHSVTSLSADNPLTVKDAVMEKLKSNNGLLMLNFGSEQIATVSTKPPDTTTLIKHLNYARDTFGVDYIGIGAGFDSSEQYKPILSSPAEFPDLFDKLAEGIEKAQPWSESDLKKLAGQNFERVLKAVEKFRDSQADVKPYDYEEEEKKPEPIPDDDKPPTP